MLSLPVFTEVKNKIWCWSRSFFVFDIWLHFRHFTWSSLRWVSTLNTLKPINSQTWQGYFYAGLQMWNSKWRLVGNVCSHFSQSCFSGGWSFFVCSLSIWSFNIPCLVTSNSLTRHVKMIHPVCIFICFFMIFESRVPYSHFSHVNKFLVTGRNFLSQKEISCHRKKLRARKRNFLSQEQISCDRKKFPVTGRYFLSQEETLCHRKNFPFSRTSFLW